MVTDDFSQSSAQVVLYKECAAKAANDGRPLMDVLVEKTRLGLQQKATGGLDAAERQQVVEAGRLLGMHAGLLTERFPLTLAAAFSEALASDSKQGARPEAKVVPASALRFDQLELMDESQVQESIELARAQQIAMAAAELPLAELNGLVCSLLGLKTVQPDRNPFRPEIYVKALRTVLTLTGVDNRVRLQWMQVMGGALGERLRSVYGDLSSLLEARGVRPVGYVVTQTPQAGQPQTAASRPGAAGRGAGGGVVSGGAGPVSRGGSGGAGIAGGGSGGTGSSRQSLLTVDQLRRLLAGELDSARQSLEAATGALRTTQPGMFRGGSGGGGAPGGRAGAAGLASGGGRDGVGGAADDGFPPHQDFDNTVPAAFEALEEMRQVERVIKRLEGRKPTAGVAPVLPAGGIAPDITFDHLRNDARGVGQALGLEVVNLMFENITQDSNLLPPVQAVLRRLEPAYLRLALIDPRFFSDKQHVARRLLDQMTERSLGYATLMAPGFDSFLRSLREVAETLAAAQVKDTGPFEQALHKLRADWDRHARQEVQQREKAVHTLLHAEQRNLLAERLATDLRARPGAGTAPPEVMNFITGPWSQVLAEARLRDRKGSPDPGGYLAIVNDLIWTTQPEQTRMNLERIKGMIPAVLERLREGLELVDYPAGQIDAFSMMLMSLYENMQQPGMSTVNERALTAQDHTGNDTTTEPTNDPWLRPTEMQDTGFLDVPEAEAETTDFKNTEPLFESTAPDVPVSEADKRAIDRARPPIPPGSWVELRLHDQTLRAQLTWASPYGTLFMFTDAAGATHSLTRRAIDKLLARGSVTLITQGVVDDALDAVAQAALRNSVDITL